MKDSMLSFSSPPDGSSNLNEEDFHDRRSGENHGIADVGFIRARKFTGVAQNSRVSRYSANDAANLIERQLENIKSDDHHGEHQPKEDQEPRKMNRKPLSANAGAVRPWAAFAPPNEGCVSIKACITRGEVVSIGPWSNGATTNVRGMITNNRKGRECTQYL